jgi:hypothetical protein
VPEECQGIECSLALFDPRRERGLTMPTVILIDDLFGASLPSLAWGSLARFL